MTNPRKKIYTKTEEIDADTAQLYLEQKSPWQRPMSLTKVDKYAQTMLAGLWQHTGEAVMFDWDGYLVNGQHRLKAVTIAKKTVRFEVTYNVDPDAFRVIDQGVQRSSAHLAAIMFKRKYGPGAAPAASAHLTAIQTAMIVKLSPGLQPDREYVAELAVKNYKLINRYFEIMRSCEVYTSRLVGAFCNADLYYGRNLIEPLAHRITDETWSGQGDPLRALHDRLFRGRHKLKRTDHLTRVDQYAMTVAAIRATLEGSRRVKLEGSSQDFGEAEIDSRLKARGRHQAEEDDAPEEGLAVGAAS